MPQDNNKMSVMQLTILTAVNMMGSGIIMLPTKLAEVGTISIISWLVTATGSTALAYAFAKCGLFSKKSGGMGGYAEYSFGKAGNFLANYTYAISLVIANVPIALSVVGYATEFLEVSPTPLQVGLWTVFVIWLTTVLNFGGAKITGKIGSFTILGVIVPVLVLCFAGWFWFSGELYTSAWNPSNTPWFEAISTSISITLWSFLGLESACANTDAVENPEKSVPIAVMGATIGVGIVYIISTNVMAGIVPNAALANSTAPFGLVFATMFNGTIGKIVMGMMVIACFGSLLGWQFTVAQVFKTSALEGYFPKVFNRVTKNNVPLIGMIILGLVQTFFTFMTISPSLSKQFGVLVDLAVVTNVIPYLLSMAAVAVIQEEAGIDKNKAKLTNFIAFIGSVYSLYALYATGLVAMTYGAIITFAGWTLYGFVSRKFDLKTPHTGSFSNS